MRDEHTDPMGTDRHHLPAVKVLAIIAYKTTSLKPDTGCFPKSKTEIPRLGDGSVVKELAIRAWGSESQKTHKCQWAWKYAVILASKVGGQ